MYSFLQIALHVSGGSSAHHQKHKTVHTASGIVKPIVHLIHDSSRQQYWFDNTWLYVQFYFCAPDDGQKNRLKHVQQFTETNKRG
jgi:hypothetical protein